MNFNRPQGIKPEALFVYGTLRKNHPGPLAHWLNGHAVWVGGGFFQGLLYEIDHYPGAIPSNNPKHLIAGDIFHLPRPGRVLKMLDDYEECSANYPRPHEYKRLRQNVLLPGGGALSAWIYLYNLPVRSFELIPSGDYALHAKNKRGSFKGSLKGQCGNNLNFR